MAIVARQKVTRPSPAASFDATVIDYVVVLGLKIDMFYEMEIEG